MCILREDYKMNTWFIITVPRDGIHGKVSLKKSLKLKDRLTRSLTHLS